MADEERTCVALMRAIKSNPPVGGSEVMVAGCGCACWVAPSSRQALALDPTLSTACLECLGLSDPRQIIAMLASGDAQLAPGAVQEVRERFTPKEG